MATGIQKYGFQELPKFDATLGAIKAGNGRIEALHQMEQSKGDGAYELPLGLAKLKESGDWVMPIVVGTDAGGSELARACAVDSNNLTLSGGDMTISDQVRLWDPEMYLEVLRKVADKGVYPVSVDPQDIDMLLALRNMPTDWHEESPVNDKDEGLEMQLVVLCPPENYEELIRMIRQLLGLLSRVGGEDALMLTPRLLISHFYLRSKNTDLIDFCRQTSGSFDYLIDCGAFSDHNFYLKAIMENKNYDRITIEEYCAACARDYHLWSWGYFNLDVIGNRDGSIENYRKMLAFNLKPIPIMHHAAPEAHFQEYFSTCDGRMGVGGIAGKKAGRNAKNLGVQVVSQVG